MELAIIAGSRLFPILLASQIKRKKNIPLLAICFKNETSRGILKYVDKAYWIEVGQLKLLSEILKKEKVKECIMAGQINPLNIFKNKKWDNTLSALLEDCEFRPHSVFARIIAYLEKTGVKFLDSTLYLKESLAGEGGMNNLDLSPEVKEDVDFGVKIASSFVNLDIGQTLIVKKKTVVAAEALEGTDRTIKRAYKLAGKDCLILKFSKINQDLRFDVPVVGLSTLKLLKIVAAKALALEAQRVLILEKERFLCLAEKWKIPVWGVSLH